MSVSPEKDYPNPSGEDPLATVTAMRYFTDMYKARNRIIAKAISKMDKLKSKFDKMTKDHLALQESTTKGRHPGGMNPNKGNFDH